MEDETFDRLCRASDAASTRRSLMRGMAAVLGAIGVGIGWGLDAEADKSKKKKRNERRRKQEKREEKRKDQNHQCDYKDKVCDTPASSCQSVACVDHKCVTSTLSDGAACGNGVTCDAGQCVCPSGVCNVTVTPSDMAGWALYNEQTDEQIEARFVSGPETPPLGIGSALLETVVSQNKQMMSARILNGTKLADLTKLSYATFVNNSEFNTAPHFQFGITRNIDDPKNFWEGRLVFAPGLGDVVQDEWQQWNVLDPSRAWFFISKGGYPDVPHCTQPARCTFPEVLQHYPGIAINPVGPSPENNGSGWGLIGVMVGSGEGVVNATFDDVRVAANGVEYRFNFDPDS